MVNVLIQTESWSSGGIEAFVAGLIHELRNEGYSFTVYSVHDSQSVFDECLNNDGVRRVSIFRGVKPNIAWRLICGLLKFRSELLNNSYDIVHINAMNASGLLYARIAKKCGIKNVIVHSHNSDVGDINKYIKRAIHAVLRRHLSSLEISRLACSKQAGRYMFGNTPFEIVNNGIEVQRFVYKEDERDITRNDLGLAHRELLFGNLSRLSSAKNPLFQLEVFKEIALLRGDAKYLMLNTGELEHETREKIRSLGLEDKVIQIAPSKQVERYYFAMDVMVFPSRFEGLPFMAIEAQCSGLPILCSTMVSREIQVTDCATHFIPLDHTALDWARVAIKVADEAQSINREKYADFIRESPFDRKKSIEIVRCIYRRNKGDEVK